MGVQDLRAWIDHVPTSKQPQAAIMDSRRSDEYRPTPPALASGRDWGDAPRCLNPVWAGANCACACSP